ncbi:MAG: M23 family metallopeptidase [Candidatus Zixiibacteriota bacterium]
MKQHMSMLRYALLLSVLIILVPFHHGCAEDLAKSVAPIQVRVPFVPPPFLGNGRVHIAYELHLANFRDIEFTLNQIEIFAPEDPSHPLATFTGPELLACLLRPGKPADLADPKVIRGGEFAVVFLWVTMEPGISLPPSVAHRATFSRLLSDGSEKEYLVEGAVTRVPTETPISIHPPLPAGRWLMANGPAMLSEHRLFLHALDGRATNTQRFAADWMLLGPDGRLVKDKPEDNDGWYSHGVPVLAVADAIVAALSDGIPENVPLSEERAVPNRRETMTGNYVILKLDENRFAFYGHLQPGSLRVKVGDHVRVGQELGRIGNTGNSDAPHLHFHVADGSDPLSGEGVPFVIVSFRLLDELDVSSWESLLVENVPWEPTTDRQPELRHKEMPLGEAIIEFR